EDVGVGMGGGAERPRDRARLASGNRRRARGGGLGVGRCRISEECAGEEHGACGHTLPAYPVVLNRVHWVLPVSHTLSDVGGITRACQAGYIVERSGACR